MLDRTFDVAQLPGDKPSVIVKLDVFWKALHADCKDRFRLFEALMGDRLERSAEKLFASCGVVSWRHKTLGLVIQSLEKRHDLTSSLGPERVEIVEGTQQFGDIAQQFKQYFHKSALVGVTFVSSEARLGQSIVWVKKL